MLASDTRSDSDSKFLFVHATYVPYEEVALHTVGDDNANQNRNRYSSLLPSSLPQLKRRSMQTANNQDESDDGILNRPCTHFLRFSIEPQRRRHLLLQKR
jgi:hypothetical protein